ncbi:hypothetical protein [Clostridium manihotivorum]|uniref:Uncharacterized protein n=1 Tax=Clostridium manihotivorum TaxID=2320868 RepID=A0A3R5UD14_9CLOT|nr:hypothetical protein [Clostridium manihotivorum]QAA30354.1 hypothetical protein C1I91_00895 [Clostridium manihotivorum]
MQKSRKYNYSQIDSNVIMFVAKDQISRYTNDNLERIASNTANTWQRDRNEDELLDNTIQGKIAEDMFGDFIEFYQTQQDIIYTSYDEFREDDFEKHAPIDGILCKAINDSLRDGIKRINEDIRNGGKFGKISNETRAFLKSKQLYTVEIKSSIIPIADYNGVDKSNFSNVYQQRNLIKNLRKRDMFVYPEFTRTLGKTVHDFKKYCEHVGENNRDFRGITGEDLIQRIIKKELETKCSIYTRIFFDFENTSSIIGYITGYALGSDFFIEPEIMNISKKNKSESAIYYKFPIEKCKNMLQIFNDTRIWR